MARVAAIISSVQIGRQILIYPVTDHDFATGSYREFADGMLLTREAMIYYWNCYAPAPRDRTDFKLSPLRAASLAGVAQAFIMTAEFDPLRDEGEAYAVRLREAGVPVVVRRYAGLIHGFLAMHQVSAAARQANDDIYACILETAMLSGTNR
jgi:acetyl esterase